MLISSHDPFQTLTVKWLHPRYHVDKQLMQLCAHREQRCSISCGLHKSATAGKDHKHTNGLSNMRAMEEEVTEYNLRCKIIPNKKGQK